MISSFFYVVFLYKEAFMLKVYRAAAFRQKARYERALLTQYAARCRAFRYEPRLRLYAQYARHSRLSPAAIRRLCTVRREADDVCDRFDVRGRRSRA